MFVQGFSSAFVHHEARGASFATHPNASWLWAPSHKLGKEFMTYSGALVGPAELSSVRVCSSAGSEGMLAPAPAAGQSPLGTSLLYSMFIEKVAYGWPSWLRLHHGSRQTLQILAFIFSWRTQNHFIVNKNLPAHLWLCLKQQSFL